MLDGSKNAVIVRTQKFICIDTYSGYRSLVRDPQGNQFVLSAGAEDKEIGSALREAIAASRLIPIDEMYELRDLNGLQKRADEWIVTLMARYGYKTKAALLRKMILCNVKEKSGFLTISPTHHEKLESWGADKSDGFENVIIPSSSSLEEIGAAVKLALSRCTGAGALDE